MSATGGEHQGETVAAGALPTRDEVIADAGAWLAETWDRLDVMSPREQAEAAWKPGGPAVDELEDRIRAQRGLPALDRGERGAA